MKPQGVKDNVGVEGGWGQVTTTANKPAGDVLLSTFLSSHNANRCKVSLVLPTVFLLAAGFGSHLEPEAPVEL